MESMEDPGSTHPFTDAENRVAYTVNALSILLIPGPNGNVDIETLSKHIEDLSIPTLCAPDRKTFLCEKLHACYVYIDILLILAKTCTSLEAATLRATCFGHIRTLQEYATQMSAKGNGGQKSPFFNIALEGLKEERTLAELFGESSLNEFAERVAASAKEAWEGVGKIVMPSSS